jgi:hypothetical protein
MFDHNARQDQSANVKTVPSQEAQSAQQRGHGRLGEVARISAVYMLKNKEARDISSLQ